MEQPPAGEHDIRRIRTGLTLLAVVVLAGIVIALAVDAPIVRVFMAGIVVFTVVRMFLLTRSVRRDGRRRA